MSTKMSRLQRSINQA